MNKEFCANCGKQIGARAKFCPNCGAQIEREGKSFSLAKNQSSEILKLSQLFLWVNVILGIVAGFVSENPFWTSPQACIALAMETMAAIVLIKYIFMGAKWARVSAYIMAMFLLLGIVCLCLLGEVGTLGALEIAEALIFIAGVALLLLPDASTALNGKNYKSESGWLVCVVVWCLFIGSAIISPDSADATENDTVCSVNEDYEDFDDVEFDDDVSDSVKRGLKVVGKAMAKSSPSIAKKIGKPVVLGFLALIAWLVGLLKKSSGKKKSS